MATAEPTAAKVMAAVGTGAGAALTRTVLRRMQRQATLRALRAKVECVVSRECSLAEELVQRFLLIAPVLAAGLSGKEVRPLARRRRNVAEHVFDVQAADIASASGVALNRLQRGGGGEHYQKDATLEKELADHLAYLGQVKKDIMELQARDTSKQEGGWRCGRCHASDWSGAFPVH